MSIGDIKHRIKNANFIGVCGFAQSGKDTIVKILETIGFKRVSLADPVRQGIYNINPIVFVDDEFHYLLKSTKCLMNNPSTLFYNLRDIVNNTGWDNAKKIPEVRRLLQYYGTEGAREIFGDKIWLDTADKYIKENNINKVAVSDIRFPNELDWIRSKDNNLIIKIKRDGIGPINSHCSDLGIKDELCDIIITNDGTIKDLTSKLL